MSDKSREQDMQDAFAFAETLVSIRVGDKVEVFDTANDRVCQGWVENISLFPNGHRHTSGANTGFKCFGEIVFKGDNPGYAYHLFDTDEVRILVKAPIPPKVGDKIRRPVAKDFPVGTIVKSGSDQPWIVLAIDNPTPNRVNANPKIYRFVHMTNYNRTHNFLTAVYTIVRVGNE